MLKNYASIVLSSLSGSTYSRELVYSDKDCMIAVIGCLANNGQFGTNKLLFSLISNVKFVAGRETYV